MEMRHGHYEDSINLVSEDQPIGKSPGAAPPQPSIHFLPSVGKFDDTIECGGDLQQEVRAEAWRLRFVVANGLAQFCLSDL